MAAEEEKHAEKGTRKDYHLARIYYQILVAFVKSAKHDERITYGDLIRKAQEAEPNDPLVRGAIARNAGRRLGFVRRLTESLGYPDLTSLVVNRSDGECGSGFTRSYDPDEVREKVFAFNWAAVSDEIATSFDEATKHLTKKPKRKQITEEQAAQLMSDYYKQHKQALPPRIRELREKLIELIMSGLTAEQAFEQVLVG